jgi:hypothetical protein
MARHVVGVMEFQSEGRTMRVALDSNGEWHCLSHHAVVGLMFRTFYPPPDDPSTAPPGWLEKNWQAALEHLHGKVLFWRDPERDPEQDPRELYEREEDT